MISRPGYTEKVKRSNTIRCLRECGDLRWRTIECVLVEMMLHKVYNSDSLFYCIAINMFSIVEVTYMRIIMLCVRNTVYHQNEVTVFHKTTQCVFNLIFYLSKSFCVDL